MRPTIRFHICDRAHKSDIAIGPGKIALLEAIEATGSITAAARQLGLSYRRAWLMVEETNRCLVRAAVTTATGGRRGGGTALTPTGVELCRRYRSIERELGRSVAHDLGAMLRNTPANRSGS